MHQNNFKDSLVFEILAHLTNLLTKQLVFRGKMCQITYQGIMKRF